MNRPGPARSDRRVVRLACADATKEAFGEVRAGALHGAVRVQLGGDGSPSRGGNAQLRDGVRFAKGAIG